MFSTYESIPHRLFSGAAAVAVIAFAGLALDQAHLSAAPSGTVEIGELTPVGIERLAQATLPEIVITAERTAAQGPRFAGQSAPGRAGIVAVAR